MNQNFIDHIKLWLQSGDGGAGAISFLREPGNPKGGPDGGDGGRGGHIIVRGNRNLWTLMPFRYRRHIKAERGMNGGKNHRTGKQGEDVVLDVPLGTVIRDGETEAEIFEITKHGEERILMAGGRGGQGNSHFKSSTNQTPRYAQPGEEGIEGYRVFELKVLADVGLVGFPNAGKSTLLSVLSAAKPKIANYPFTTLVPQLGIVSHRESNSFVMADIPGIIERAHEGKGLGHRFLRHIERNATLLFVIAADSDDIKKEYAVLLNELEQYNPELLDKPRVLAISKADLLDEELRKLLEPELPEGVDTVFISAVAQRGLVELKDLLWTSIRTGRDVEYYDL